MSKVSEKEMDPNKIIDNEADLNVFRISEDVLDVHGSKFEIVTDYREALDLIQLDTAYTTFFDKYDFVVGDISKNQLRLRGFYKDDHPEYVPLDMKISYLEDYLAEYCSYGAAYFVLKRLDSPKNFTSYKTEDSLKTNKRRKRKNTSSKTTKKNYKEPKKSQRSPKKSPKSQFVKKEKEDTKPKASQKETVKKVKSNNREFQIKKKK